MEKLRGEHKVPGVREREGEGKGSARPCVGLPQLFCS